jgi:hypothetical protein
MLLLLATLALAAPPCPHSLQDPDLERLRQSKEFGRAVTAAWQTYLTTSNPMATGTPDSTEFDWWIESLCVGLRIERHPFLPSAAFAAAPYLYGIEISFLRFGINKNAVTLLNARAADGTIRVETSPQSWNAFVDQVGLVQPLSTPALASSFACFVDNLDVGGGQRPCAYGWPEVGQTPPWKAPWGILLENGHRGT